MSTNPTTSEGNLQRGKACLECRRRKMKCDGARPVCNQCQRTHREDDCEYNDTQGRPRTQILQEELTRLQARIQELENPASASSSITLHNPYIRQQEGAPIAGQPALRDPSRTTPWWELDDPPKQIVDRLIDQFLPHATQLGFSLNVARFRTALNLPPSHPMRPHPALLHSIFLWAVRLSKSEEITAHEPRFLARAALSLTAALGRADPQQRVQALQAEVLLAQYFFCLGRFLEGRYHANAAVSIAISCGLHRIRSSEPSPAPGASPTALMGGGILGAGSVFDLLAPQDMLEEGERINAFWTVFNLDRCWSVAAGMPIMLYDDPSLGTQIDTPWPLEVEAYERMNPSTAARFSRTVQRFLAGQPGESPANETSSLALRAKASALLNQATRMAATWNPTNAQAGIPEMQRLHQLITEFHRSLLPIENAKATSQELALQLIVVHTLVHGSMVQLHNVRADVDIHAANFCLSHARQIVLILDHLKTDYIGFLDPVIGTMWLAAAHVFIRDLMHVRKLAPTSSTKAREEVDVSHIGRITAVLSEFENCPVLGFQIARINERLQG